MHLAGERCARSSPNMVTGVTQGFEKKLSLVGVGYRAQAHRRRRQDQPSSAHPVVHYFDAEGRHRADARADGDPRQGHRQTAGRPGRRGNPLMEEPEPYKGKGVRYAASILPQEGREK